MVEHAYYPMNIDVVMVYAVPVMVSINYLISIYCAVDDRCALTFPVKPIFGFENSKKDKTMKDKSKIVSTLHFFVG